jgi:MFS family permease
MALVRGLFLGYALAFGLVMISHAVPRIDPRHRRIYLTGWVSFAGLLLISPAIIAPAIQYSIPAAVLSDTLARWLWAIAIAAAPDLIAIGIAVNGKLLQVAQAETTTTTGAQPTATKKQPKQEPPQPVKRELSDVALQDELTRNPGATQAQLAAMFEVSPQAISKRIRKMKGTV